jgi:hypothetical protein
MSLVAPSPGGNTPGLVFALRYIARRSWAWSVHAAQSHANARCWSNLTAHVLLRCVPLSTSVGRSFMRIICATPQAAARVVSILFAACLEPVRDFEIRPILAIEPPITFTMLVVLAAAHVTKIHAIADTTIVG